MKALKSGTFRTEPAEFYGTPKELWGFRSDRGKGSAEKIAKDFLAANAELLGLEADVDGLRHDRTVRSLAARHVIYQQLWHSRRVHRAYVTVHITNGRQVYLTKNRAMPRPMLPEKANFDVPASDAVSRAKRALPKKLRRAAVQTTEALWFPKKERLLPAWRVRLCRTGPREEWIVYINAATGGVLSKYDNLSKATGCGHVFDPSPVTALGGHADLLSARGNQRKPPPEAYTSVALRNLKSNGRLEGKRVTTAPTSHRKRIRRPDRDFRVRSRQKGFEEVMVYYHIDRAIRYLETLGFRGAKAIFRDPVRANVNGTRQDNSWYSPWEKLLTFGIGAIDDAEDAETILHELSHAIQDAIIPDFGQSEEAAAIGEGFGDYFAASFFAERKPAHYRTCVMTWDGLLIGLDEGRDPPCLRRVDEDWTYDDFIEGDDEHANGEIWSATLWDVREKLGRRTADQLIIESHVQLDGFTTFARAARAIVDADENLNGGANRNKIKNVFRARQIGPI